MDSERFAGGRATLSAGACEARGWTSALVSGDKVPFMHRLLSLCVLALLICSPAAASGGKTLRMAYDADPASLDPHEQLSGATLQLSHLVFDPLVASAKT